MVIIPYMFRVYMVIIWGATAFYLGSYTTIGDAWRFLGAWGVAWRAPPKKKKQSRQLEVLHTWQNELKKYNY